MSQSALDDIDPEMRAQLEAAAAAQGRDVGELLNETLLRKLLQDSHADEAPAPRPREDATLGLRVDLVERRLSVALTTFDTTIASVDQSVAALAANLETQAAHSDDAGRHIDAALAEIRASISALDTQFGAARETLALEQSVLREQIALSDQRIAEADAVASAAADIATGAHEALYELEAAFDSALEANADEAEARRADTEDRLRGEWRTATEKLLQEAHAAANEATLHAEAAAARALNGMRDARDALEIHVNAAIDDTRAHLDKVFDHTTELYDTLNSRIAQGENSVTSRFEATASDMTALAEGIEEIATLVTETEENVASRFEATAGRFATIDTTLERVAERILEDSERATARSAANSARIGQLDCSLSDLATRQAEERSDTAVHIEAASAHLSAIDAAIVRLSSRVAHGEQEILDEAGATAVRFAELNAFMSGLASRLADDEHTNAVRAGAADARLSALDASVRDAIAILAQTADETQDSLRAAVQNQALTHTVAMQAHRAEFEAHLADIRDRHMGASARLQLIDAAIAHSNDAVANLQAAFDQGLTAATDEAHQRISLIALQADARIDSLTQQVLGLNDEARALRDAANEALEAMEQRFTAQIQEIAHAHRADAESTAESLATGIADLHTEHKGVLARLALMDQTLQAQTRTVTTCEQNTAAFGQTLARAESEFAAVHAARDTLSQLATRIGKLEAEPRKDDGARLVIDSLADRIANLEDAPSTDETARTVLSALAARVDQRETHATETSDRLGDLARLVSDVSNVGADRAVQAQERIHQLEVALASLRFERAVTPAAPPFDRDALLAEAGRAVDELDERYAQQLTALSDQLAVVIRELHERLALLEAQTPKADIQALRLSVEERILGLEVRCIRALESIGETVAVLSTRSEDDEQESVAKTA